MPKHLSFSSIFPAQGSSCKCTQSLNLLNNKKKIIIFSSSNIVYFLSTDGQPGINAAFKRSESFFGSEFFASLPQIWKHAVGLSLTSFMYWMRFSRVVTVTASVSPPTHWNKIWRAAYEAMLNKVPKKDNLLKNERGSQYMIAKIVC